MPEYRTEPLVVPSVSGLLPESERSRRVALTSFPTRAPRVQVPTREVVCYECGHRSSVPMAALSSNCIHCHAHLDMSDIELRPGSRRLTVRTLGNVTIQQDAVLSHLSVVCNNLTIQGRASGDFSCSGIMQLSASSRIEGRVRVGKLVVDRGVNAVFSQGVKTGEAEIRGRVTGRVDADTSVTLYDCAELCGDCHSPVMHREEGSSFFGRWIRTEAT